MKKPVSVGLCALAVAVSFCYGVLAHRHNLIPVSWARAWLATGDDDGTRRPPGYWGVARDGGAAANGELSAQEQAELLALPYVQASQPGPDRRGVTRHDARLAFPGVNLYVSGHAPEARLIDMEGRVLHRWAVPFERAFPDLDASKRPAYWRRALLLDDGDLLAIYEYTGLVRLDRDSAIRWVHREKSHHAIDVDAAGRIYVLTQENRRNPRDEAGQPIADDTITILSATGEVLDRLSIYDCLDRSRYAGLLDRIEPAGDVFHANAIRVLDGSQQSRSPLFGEGNLLISIRELDTIAIVDPRAREVIWSLGGLWREQHEPVLLPGGRLLVFDNRPRAERSRVIELDPFTQEIVWEYRGDDDEPFHSRIGGANQRLPNGNTLITETEYGRAIEVTPAGRVVWEFVNPERGGERGELIAVLWDVVRLDPALARFAE